MERAAIVARIESALPGASVEISGEDCSFSVDVTSPDFTSQRLLQRQRVILALFATELSNGELHALTIVAKTPEERAEGLVQLSI